ncbi:MAG: galactokinase [Bacteroidetes bacterium]|nr:MAG: galactokinase [Bacteroidota bacterium]
MNDHLAKKVKKIFLEKFHKEPLIVFSPGRINMIGEHVDYNDGYVMPAAVDKGIYFALAENNTDTSTFYAADLNEEFSIPLNAIAKDRGWKNYVLGIIDQLLKKKYLLRGFDCVFSGDVPVGAGMSSSAAVECGLGHGLDLLFHLKIDRVFMAKLGQKAEHEFPGVNCGIMDQFANMMGKKDHVFLLDCRTLEYSYLKLPLGDYSILLINSKVHHSLASSEYNVRRQQCEEGIHYLKKNLPNILSLRDVNENDLKKYGEGMNGEVYERCLFVVQEIKRTVDAATCLEQNNLNRFGKLMYASHEGLAGLYKVSCEEIDFLVDLAKLNPNITGSRIMGGGFGGCTINIIHRDQADAFANSAIEAYKRKFRIEAEAYKIRLENGTSQVNA